MHDFKRFPELRNNQLDFYYFLSPHKQIFEDFKAKVVNVHDGDTITLRTDFRDFDFPLRFLDINAPELNEKGGHESKSWLEKKILNEEVEIIIDPKNRVDKWGRLLGKVRHEGMILNEEAILVGMATPFDQRDEGRFPEISKTFRSDWGNA